MVQASKGVAGMNWNAWVNLVVGILLIISPFVLGFSSNTTATWTTVIGGIIVAVVAALNAVSPARVGPRT
jgi:hypothetical protein